MENNIKLNYRLETPQERINLVNQILQMAEDNNKNLNKQYIEILSDYIISAMTKAEKHGRKILTDNRLVTINKREVSFESITEKLENGENGIYRMIEDNKNVLLTPKISITDKDLAEIKDLRQLKELIKKIEALEKNATGLQKYHLKKQLIEMRQDQYIIKDAFRKPMGAVAPLKNMGQINFEENIHITEDGVVTDDGLISLFNPKHISALLCNYSALKQDAWGKFQNDMFYLMEDLDNLVEKTLKDKYPLYYDLLIYKIDGLTNIEIQALLEKDYKIKYSVEYISSLWRNKIPKLIAEQAQEDYLIWYYTNVERGSWKRCSCCGQVKLRHNKFFSKNKTSKDGYYSICKECRNKKSKK